jgi:hypothetical protein
MQNHKVVAVGGASFIVAALAFVLVFAYLAANFDYPSILDGTAAEVLPRLLDGGSTMRAVWAVYAFLPLLLVPGGVGAYSACPSSRPRMRLALVAVSMGSLAMCLGLMRWPSLHWALAEAYSHAGTEAKDSLAAVFVGMNVYLGNYIGEFLGETMVAAFFLLSGLSMLDEARLPRWVGRAGVGVSLLLVIGALRNVTSSVLVVADVNNAVLPLWLMVMGAALIWYSGRAGAIEGAALQRARAEHEGVR